MKALLEIGRVHIQLKQTLKRENIKYIIKLVRADIEADKDKFKKRGKKLNKKFKLMKELLVLREFVRR